ncbi:hypothetical protein QO206_01285 [Leeuwenhoekiella aequorea]|uniref:hypothetical protein n=1 Tax=Leeuwenhoekiella aequorea TaxID=283736 RepID=UPI00352CC3F1
MAPMKFEENIREKLEKREINPSPSAWEQIESELDASAARKEKKSFGWFFIAASFIGILVIAGMFFLNTDLPENQQIVVNPVEEIKTQEQITDAIDEVNVPDKELELNSSPEDALVNEKKIEEKSVITKKPTQMFAATEKTKKIEPLEEPVKNLINTEVDNLLSKVEQQENTGVAYSDAEIDKLLREAQREIITEKLFKNAQQEVSAQALLYEVEEELDPSFRDRIFEALKEGFVKAREAVVSRNN